MHVSRNTILPTLSLIHSFKQEPHPVCYFKRNPIPWMLQVLFTYDSRSIAFGSSSTLSIPFRCAIQSKSGTQGTSSAPSTPRQPPWMRANNSMAVINLPSLSASWQLRGVESNCDLCLCRVRVSARTADRRRETGDRTARSWHLAVECQYTRRNIEPLTIYLFHLC